MNVDVFVQNKQISKDISKKLGPSVAIFCAGGPGLKNVPTCLPRTAYMQYQQPASHLCLPTACLSSLIAYMNNQQPASLSLHRIPAAYISPLTTYMHLPLCLPTYMPTPLRLYEPP